MRIDARRTIIGLLIAGVTGAILFPFAIYFIGLALAPPRPVAAQTPARPILADAIWAKTEGGRATSLTPVTPITMGRFAACMAVEDFKDTTPGDARRAEVCRKYLPAIQNLEYLSGLHVREANIKPASFRGGLARLSTTIWMTHSWTKAEFVNTLAERGEFGHGLRGAEAAAWGYFDRTVAELTLSQAAMLAAFVGGRGPDPWCDPEAAAGLRHTILESMRDANAIDERAFAAADASELGLTRPPALHQPCD